MIVFAGHDRQYTLPKELKDSGREHVTGWELLALSQRGSEWATGVLASLEPMTLAEGTYLGVPDAEDEDVLRELVRDTGSGYESFDPETQEWMSTTLDGRPAVDLDPETASALYDAQQTGASLALRFFDPIAWLPPSNESSAIPLTSAVEQAEPGKWKHYAIVDELDHGAVLNLIRLAPGPVMEVYAADGWEPDKALLADLRGVTPPLLTELDDTKLNTVLQQVDSFYQKNPPVPESEGDEPEDDEPMTAVGKSISPAVRERTAESGEAMEDGSFPIRDKSDLSNAIHAYGRAKDKEKTKRHIIKRARALKAVDMLPESWGITASVTSPLPGVSPDPRAEKLRRYWSVGGKGGLKIRWGMPGDWKRCVRHLSKYMGPRAKGYCQLMHKRNTGVYTGSKLNASAGTAIEVSLLAAVNTRMWLNESDREATEMQDGIYAEVRDTEALVMETLLAAGFPVSPPDEWFADPKLEGPTPIIVENDGRVRGHIATFDVPHIGMPGNVRAPKSRSGYAYFHTGDLVTASGQHIPVGQLTLAGGHAPLSATAGDAVKHYDDTASAVADIHLGEDRFGIWAAGSVRPEVSAEQLRALRASAPSGDWRPINGNLELVAVCQVNVPGFPVARARVASGAVMALVAAGAAPLAEAKLSMLANEALAHRVQALESLVASGALVAATEVLGEPAYEPMADAPPAPAADVTVDIPDEKADGTHTPEEDAEAEAQRKITAARLRVRALKREALRARVHRANTVAASVAEETV